MRLLLYLAALVAVPAAAQDSRTEEEAFVAWVEETLIPVPGGFPAAFDAEAASRVDWCRLEPLLAGMRFVFLGEPDHFIEEKQGFRLLFLRHLYRFGWRHVGMELGRSDGTRVGEFFRTGDEAALRSVRLFGRGSPLVSSEKRFLRALRGVGAEDWRYFGYDVDTVPGGGFDDVRARLEPWAREPVVSELLESIHQAELLHGTARVDALEELLANWSEWRAGLVTHFSERELQDLELDLACLPESFRLTAAIQAAIAGGLETYPVEAFARRETMMFRQFDAYLDRLGPEDKIALLGHNLHLTPRSDEVRMVDLGHEIELWPSIGSHVVGRFPDEVLSVWLLYDHGRHIDDLTGRVEEVATKPDALEALLALASEPSFLLPLHDDDPRSTLLDRVWKLHLNGSEDAYVHPLRQIDVIAFTRTAEAPQVR